MLLLTEKPNSMHPGHPFCSLHWPENKDVRWVPFLHALYKIVHHKIDAPFLVTTHGQYHLSDASKNKIVMAW